MEANPITPERATAVYRAYIARPDIDTRTLCDMPTEQLLELAAAESEPVVTVAESDPLAWLGEDPKPGRQITRASCTPTATGRLPRPSTAIRRRRRHQNKMSNPNQRRRLFRWLASRKLFVGSYIDDRRP